jgi:uncharacterized damage-inducible protein DinB
MDSRELLLDCYGRIVDHFDRVCDGLDPPTANTAPEHGSNTISWLLWHLTRVEDDHLSGLTGEPQVWEQWRDRFGLPVGEYDTGFRHTPEQVASIRVDDVELLTAYFTEVHQQVMAYLQTVTAEELDRVVDTRWDPPVTAGVRLVSVQGDCLQHLGQAAYVKGLLHRR